MADPTLQLRPDHRRELVRLIATHLPQEDVWAYGSRVNGTAHDTSDLDLVVRHLGDLKIRQTGGFWDLKDALSESNLPFLVDVLDWATLPPAFWDNILAEHVPIHAPATHGLPTSAAPRNKTKGGIAIASNSKTIKLEA